MIDFSASEEEQLLLENAGRFADEQLRDSERAHEKSGHFSEGVTHSFAQLGLAELSLPDTEVALGLRVAVTERMAEGDPAGALALDPIGPAGRTLAGCKGGAELLASGAPGVVLVADGLKQRDGTLTGRLPWVYRPAPAWALVVQLAEGKENLWLLRQPDCRPLEEPSCGLKACAASEWLLEDTPAQAVGGSAEVGALLSEARVLTAAMMLGAARYSLRYAMQYGQERIAFGQPIAHHQGLAFDLMSCSTELQAAALLLRATADAKQLGRCEAANAYLQSLHCARHVAERALQTLGGHGYLHDHPVEKRMRDIRCLAALHGGESLAAEDAAAGVLGLSDAMRI